MRPTDKSVSLKMIINYDSLQQHSTRRRIFSSKLDLNVRKKLVKCYIWSIALCGAETWTLQKVDRKYLESFEMWCWRRMEKISWTDREK
jgi:hypothetical protein